MRWGARAKAIERAIRSHDSLLFVVEGKAGRLDINRRASNSCAPPNYVCSLTDNWTVKGRPVDWGIEVIIQRLKAHDIWRDDTIADQLIAQYEQKAASQTRDRKNNLEAFLLDIRREFARNTNDINTASLSK